MRSSSFGPVLHAAQPWNESAVLIQPVACRCGGIVGAQQIPRQCRGTVQRAAHGSQIQRRQRRRCAVVGAKLRAYCLDVGRSELEKLNQVEVGQAVRQALLANKAKGVG